MRFCQNTETPVPSQLLLLPSAGDSQPLTTMAEIGPHDAVRCQELDGAAELSDQDVSKSYVYNVAYSQIDHKCYTSDTIKYHHRLFRSSVMP